jgi:hypothetical protein
LYEQFVIKKKTSNTKWIFLHFMISVT